MAASLSTEQLLPLVDALADGQWHSGEDLAARSDITRAALAKRIEKLRDWHLQIEARQGLGYRLSSPLERLDAARLRQWMPRGVTLEVLAVADSTNTRLLEQGGAEDPQVLLAELQTGGRGRRGRVWVSPFGANLYLSIGWTFAHWPPALSALSLAVGVSCARVLRGLGVDIGVKWPNDLWVAGRKLGGILIEPRGETGGPCRAVIGVGLNLAMSASQATDIAQPWISLNQVLSTPIARNVLAVELIGALFAALRQFESSGFDSFLADWSHFDLTANRNVRIESIPPLNGVARGIDASGALIVEATGSRHIIHSGEVSLRLA